MTKRTRAFIFLISLAMVLLMTALMTKPYNPAGTRTGDSASVYIGPPVGPQCQKCGSARRTSLSDNRILTEQGFPSGLGDHPTPVTGLSYKCLDCKDVIVVYPSHWHASPLKTPCGLCKRAFITEEKK